ncbi:type II toxin-antitoxin system VapC family toxin [Undibacterium sp. Ji67W]|uniref:type II toxin-antitoxin system VapC family toxin n=1 Tax=Undibacterium sp. Ji67W TaxID=3413042 RepID=UPI003BEFF174
MEVDINDLINAISTSGFIELPVTAEHCKKIGGLPPIHKDPFDRTLIAQAMTEPMYLLTNEGHFKKYQNVLIIEA